MEEKYYGKESERAAENFPLQHKKTNVHLIHAIAEVKKAAARTYLVLGEDHDLFLAVEKACNRVIVGELDDQFITEALQGGAGTSMNMNVNEVIAAAATEILGRPVHPLDDVNRGQSTNDVCPTALRIAAIRNLRTLSDECARLQEALQKRENEFDGIDKLGRTELMDAVPITLGDEFGAYAQAIARDRWRLYKVEERLRQVNLGGTAVGTGATASRKYRQRVVGILREQTGLGLAQAEYPIDVTQNNDVFVEVSGLLKALAVNITKIANDLRLMNSGPFGGLGEIKLQAMQKGSTIMPGKVNPVIPEMTMQCAMRVMSNDSAIGMAAAHGEFELNAFFPLIAECLLESINLLERTVWILRTKCIETLEPRPERCREILESSYALATSFSPMLGYDTVAEVVGRGLSPDETMAILRKMTEDKQH